MIHTQTNYICRFDLSLELPGNDVINTEKIMSHKALNYLQIYHYRL